ncbi:hypothetical protein V8E53_003304 [Lactarius tabidus]
MNNSVGLLSRPPTAQSMGAPSISSMGTQITGAGSSGGAQSLSGPMSAPMSAPFTQAGMNGAPSSILPNLLELFQYDSQPQRRSSKRWVEAQKRLAFSGTRERSSAATTATATFHGSHSLIHSTGTFICKTGRSLGPLKAV